MDGLFNPYQEGYMRDLMEIPAEKRCYCGWHLLGECPHCPACRTCADKLADRGSDILSSVCGCNDDAGRA
jgi:hypothetical protein